MTKNIYDATIRSGRLKFLVKYLLLFTIMCIFCFLPFILDHKSFVQKDDGFNQNLPIFVYVGRFYRHLFHNIIANHTIPIYDFSIGVGGGIFTELDIYGILDVLMIPFAVLSPAKYAAYGYSLMCIFKMLVGGIGYYQFLKRKGYRQEPSIAASFFYVFSCYTYAFGLAFPSFLIVMVYLPYIVLGIDSVFSTLFTTNHRDNNRYVVMVSSHS